jgi:hypothetical protein
MNSEWPPLSTSIAFERSIVIVHSLSKINCGRTTSEPTWFRLPILDDRLVNMMQIGCISCATHATVVNMPITISTRPR